jgi:hypothetical protein
MLSAADFAKFIGVSREAVCARPAGESAHLEFQQYNGLSRGQVTETCLDDLVRQFLGG